MNSIATIPSPTMATPKIKGASALWTGLMGYFYQKRGMTIPAMIPMEPAEIPSPYHGLLVHNRDMTPTLEQFYRQTVRLKVLSHQCRADTYLREVTLWIKDEHPVEYGAILIHLRNFPERAREMILADQEPFGRILHTQGIAHYSAPQSFFCVHSDPHLGATLELYEASLLYGRINVLLDKQDRFLANVIEILSPTPETQDSLL